MRQRCQRVLERATTAVAATGAMVLLAVAGVTVHAIIGRALPPDLPGLAWWRPLRGSFELVELASALAIFSFLPYTQLKRGNVAVAVVVDRLGSRWRNVLTLLGDLLLLAFTLLLTWRMTIGSWELVTASYTRTTFLLGVPLAWAYLPATVLAGLWALVCAHGVWSHLENR